MQIEWFSLHKGTKCPKPHENIINFNLLIFLDNSTMPKMSRWKPHPSSKKKDFNNQFHQTENTLMAVMHSPLPLVLLSAIVGTKSSQASTWLFEQLAWMCLNFEPSKILGPLWHACISIRISKKRKLKAQEGTI